MGKYSTYLLVFSGISLLFYFGGLVSTNSLLDILLNPQNMTSSQMWTTILAATATTIAAIAVGFVTRDLDKAAMTAAIPFLALLLWNFVDVYVVVASFNTALSIMVFAPIMLLYLFSILELWRGRD